MMNLNRVMLAGNLTRDPELRNAGGKSVCGFGIAINHRYKTKDGKKKEEVTFIDCEAWGATADNVSQYLSKGSPVFIEGRLKLDTWEDKDGGKRSKLKVVADSVQFLASRKYSAPGSGEPDYDAAAMRIVKEQRAKVQSLSADSEPPF